jgi:outer membrane protein OmpA-like peptidoglycan-associated protein
MRKNIHLLIVIAGLSGCSSVQIGAGGGSGGLSGGVILGTRLDKPAGGGLKKYMDRQAKELKRDVKDGFVERVGDGIYMTFASNVLFENETTPVRNSGKPSLDKVAAILIRYEDTVVVIEDHMDSNGDAAFNKDVSEQRAKSVADYLQAKGVKGERLRPVGKGDENPVADSSTRSGQRANRRLEMNIVPSEKLKKDADSGEIKIPS